MTQFLDTPVDKSLSTTGTWTDIDLSGDVPVSATGAIFRVKNTIIKEWGLRKNGSTDNRHGDMHAGTQQFTIVGLDANRKCEGYIESTDVDFYLIGYTESDAILFTNATDKSLSTTGTWTDIDLSTEIPSGGVAAMVEVINTHNTFPREWGLRKNGSTDNRHGDMYTGTHLFFIVGLDANRKCEGYIESTDVDFFIIGYLSEGQAETNGIDRSLGSIGSYTDIDESSDAPSTASGVFLEVNNTTGSKYAFAGREKGTTYDYYNDSFEHHGALFSGLDINRKWEGKIENVAVDFYVMGYFAGGVTTRTEESSIGITVGERRTKESSIGLSVQETKTKESSIGITVVDRNTKESSIGITVTTQFLEGYAYRKKGTVVATVAGAQTNYQLKLLVGESSGAAGEDVDCESHCHNFPNDLRFTAADGQSKHDYWVESLIGTTPNRLATVWIEVASVPVSDTVDFYMYYGKSGDSGESNGNSAFEFFDDFEGTSLDICPNSGDKVVSADASKYEAWPGIAKYSNGDLFVVYRTCNTNTHGYCSTGKVVIRKSTNNGQTWGSEVIVSDEGSGIDERNPGILIFDDNGTETILVVYNTYDGIAANDRACCRKSTNNGVTWGSKIELSTGNPRRTWSKPIELSNGKILVPVYNVVNLNTYVIESSDGGDTWTEYTVNSIYGNEFSIIETKNGGSYTGGIYGLIRDTTSPYVYKKVTSTDYGHTWSAVSDESDFNDPYTTPISFHRAPNGELLAAYTKDTGDLLEIYESTDEGVNWTRKITAISGASISYYPVLETISSSELIICWCTNGAGSDVFVNFIDYPLQEHRWSQLEGTTQVSNSMAICNGGETDKFQAIAKFGVGYAWLHKCDLKNTNPRAFGAREQWEGKDGILTDPFNTRCITRKEDSWEIDAYSFSTGEKIYEYQRTAARVNYLIDNIEIANCTDGGDIPTEDISTYFSTYALDSPIGHIEIDWTIVRKYVLPEPTWGTWDPEEGTPRTKESSIGLSVQETKTKESSIGITVVDRNTKESSIGITVVDRNTKESSIGITVGERRTKESSIGLSVQETKTKESSIGITVVDRNTKESSIGITVGERRTKESSIGITVGERRTKESSIGITVGERRTKESSIGITVIEPNLKKGFYYAKLGGVSLYGVEKDSFRISKVINQTPSFEFEIANCAENRDEIINRITEEFEIYWQHHGEDTHVFTGIINADGIEYVSLDSIRISGFASYVKLSWPFFKHLADEDREAVNTALTYNGGYFNKTIPINNATINDVLISFGGVNHAFYIGENQPFWGMEIKYSTKGIQAEGTVVIIEYSKGSGNWATLDVLDESNAFTEVPGTYNLIIPHLPSDWARDTVNGIKKCWIRYRIVSGSYSTEPKLDQAFIVNVDIYRPYYFNTSARAILEDVLEGTGYTMDETDSCPEDIISIVAEYQSPLRIIAAIPNALTWTDTEDDNKKKAYQWWIDKNKKVHIKNRRGTTYPDDITGDLTIFNNQEDYFHLSNQLWGLGPRDGLGQMRAIIRDTNSIGTHGLREIAVSEEQIANYPMLKNSLQKKIAISKDPMQRIRGNVSTQFWGVKGYEVGDTITLHQEKWHVSNKEFQIVKVDMGPNTTTLDLGISQDHLEGLRDNMQRQINLNNIQMHGSTTLLEAGPATSNYQRVDAETVYPAKLLLEIPSTVKKTHKVLLSWTLGPYRASVGPNTGDVPAHDHDGFVGAGGGLDGFNAGPDGAHTPGILDDGAFTPQMIGGIHKHLIETDVTLNVTTTGFYALTATGVLGLNHRHVKGKTGAPDDTEYAYTQANWDLWCESCSAWLIDSFDYDEFALASHYHLNNETWAKYTEYTNPAGVVQSTPKQLIASIDANAISELTNDESPEHEHDGVAVIAHGHGASDVPDHSGHAIPTQPTHNDHPIVAESGGAVDIKYDIYEEAGGTVMELLVNGEHVGIYATAQSEIRIDGWLNSGNNTIELQPAVGENNKKGGATLKATGLLFVEPIKF